MTAIATPLVMVTPPVTREYTDKELLKLADDGVSEFVDGQVREKVIAAAANRTVARLGYYLTRHVMQFGGGDLFTEQSFRCFPDDSRGFRRPDLAYIAPGRVPSPAPAGPLTIVPDLAVEVTSPNDEIDELESTLAAYRSVAVPLVWVVIPVVRIVRVYPNTGPDHALRVGDTLTGGDVLPGFSVPVADLFRPAAPRT